MEISLPWLSLIIPTTGNHTLKAKYLSKYIDTSMKEEESFVLTGKWIGINWFVNVWLLARSIFILFATSETIKWHLPCVIVAIITTHPYQPCANPSSLQDFKGLDSGSLYSSYFPSASQEWNKLDLLHISASLCSYYFLNTAEAVFFHVYGLWDMATLWR